MTIELSDYRLRIGLHYYRQSKVKGLSYLTTFELGIILSMLRLRCGDIEQNPGPDLDSSTSSENSALPLNSPDLLNNFSVVHYNVHSLVNKHDVLETELRNFNIICISETWLHAGITDDEIAMSDFILYRRDRTGDAHGGVCVYVDKNYHSERRADLEMNNIECIWLEITIQHRKLLIGT